MRVMYNIRNYSRLLKKKYIGIKIQSKMHSAYENTKFGKRNPNPFNIDC